MVHIGDVTSVVLITSGGLGILGLLAKGAAVMRKWGKRIALFFEDWAGEPERPGVPERAGVVVRLGRLETAVLQIQSEVNHDHGTSMRDDITAIKKAVNNNDSNSSDPSVAVHVNIEPNR